MAFVNMPLTIKKLFLNELETRIEFKEYLKKNNLTYYDLLAYGKSAWIVLAKSKNKTYAIKWEKLNTTRKSAIEKEYKYLSLANTAGIGQKIISYNKDAKAIMWEFIDAKPLKQWLQTASYNDIKKVVKQLLKQSQTLDLINLDHGQLAGDGTNILVKKNAIPIIVDFEKASTTRKPHNYKVMTNFLLRGDTEISEQIVKAYQL